MNTNTTLIILGPTCTGKTSLALEFCKQFGGSIVSADSRQVVRYMDIGTGKIPAGVSNRRVDKKADRWVVDGVNIFGYDLVNPDEYFSAYNFAEYFSGLDFNGPVFLVGGTGFYMDVVTGRVPLAGNGADLELRKSLADLSVDALAARLKELSPSAYKKIDLKNPSRLIREIEKSLQGKLSTKLFPVVNSPVYIGLTSSRETLFSRADRWVDEIFSEKLFEEVRFIKKQFPQSRRLDGLIYNSTVNYIEGKTPLEETKQRAKFDMHAYIRRQQTWFKRNPKITWFDITKKSFDSDVSSIVESKLNG